MCWQYPSFLITFERHFFLSWVYLLSSLWQLNTLFSFFLYFFFFSFDLVKKRGGNACYGNLSMCVSLALCFLVPHTVACNSKLLFSVDGWMNGLTIACLCWRCGVQPKVQHNRERNDSRQQVRHLSEILLLFVICCVFALSFICSTASTEGPLFSSSCAVWW